MKIDKRKKYYMILDCETATLPFIQNYAEENRNTLSIAKPLIYDIGYQIVDVNGNIYKEVSYLIAEVFFNEQIFVTAYYAKKRPLYLERLRSHQTKVAIWQDFCDEFINDLQVVSAVGAYNSMFDFKKAIPFTEKYINAFYKAKLPQFFADERANCDNILSHKADNKTKFDPDNFIFRGQQYPLFDVWGLACEHLLNNDDFREFCARNNYISNSGKYYSTSAETAYQFLMLDDNFKEAHMAIDDAKIETEIFALITKKLKHKFERGIIYFPFKIIGEVEER